MKEYVQIEVTIGDESLSRKYKVDEGALEDDIFWGEECVDMFETIKNLKEDKF